jgi:hypothetical protein
MDRMQTSEDSLTVTELKGGGGGGGVVLDSGTYEAEYMRMKLFMDNTPWGEKKCVRLYFKITRGKYKDQATSYKGTLFLDNETQQWIVGSKSKLADAIRAVTGGKTISPENAGTKVFVVVKKKTSKQNREYSFVDSIIPRPEEDGETLAESTEAVQRTAPTVARPAPARPATKPAIPAPADDSGDGLLADLTELSDFKD